MRSVFAACLLAVLAARPASAHVAFSSVELHITATGVDVTIVAQAIDLAHELGIDPPARLVELDFLVSERDALAKLAGTALTLTADGAPLEPRSWGVPAAAPDQQLVRLRARYDLDRAPGVVGLTSRLFSYDTAHQTLVTVYEDDTLETQQMLDAARASFDYFMNTRAGARATVGRFSRIGFARAFAGYDHLLFVAALLLAGGTPRRVMAIALAFTASYSAALALGAAGVLTPPMAIIAPGAALSVVYAGVDNLMIRGGRDVRVLVGLAFGWLHGFSLANTLNAMDRPIHRAIWAIASFNLGIEAAFLLTAVGLVSIASLAGQSGAPGRFRILTVASGVVAAFGAASFIRHIVAR